MIVDQVKVIFQSGSGGKGSSSLIRLSSGKDIGIGGDGGRGGNVILKVNLHLYDLKSFKGNKKFIAASGEGGFKQNKKGKDAEDLIVGVPAGTRVIDREEIIADLIATDDQLLLCRGGAGGRGNYKRNYTLEPKPGQRREVVLDYRIPNDLAILGFANSGKTSLYNALCRQNQKVADYPFTTTSCVSAPCECESGRVVILDTPPLTRITKPTQAQKNNFLRQIWRSRILIFLSNDPLNYRKDFDDISTEIERFNLELLKGKTIFYLLAGTDTKDKKFGNHSVIAVDKDSDLDQLKKKITVSLD